MRVSFLLDDQKPRNFNHPKWTDTLIHLPHPRHEIRRWIQAKGPSRSAFVVPRWAQLASQALALAGLAISIYLTIEHFSTPALLACPDTGMVNCQKVTGSPQSTVLGMPVAVLGLVFFAAMAWLTHPRVWPDRRPSVRRARLVGVIAGVVFVLYLIYVELFVVDAICPWCTAIHAIAVGLFAVVVLGITAPAPNRR